MPVHFNIQNQSQRQRVQHSDELVLLELTESESMLGTAMQAIHHSQEAMHSVMEQGIDSVANGVVTAAKALDSFTGKVLHIAAHHPIKLAMAVAGIFVAGVGVGVGFGSTTSSNRIANNRTALASNAGSIIPTAMTTTLESTIIPVSTVSTTSQLSSTNASETTVVNTTQPPKTTSATTPATTTATTTATTPAPALEPCELEPNSLAHKYLSIHDSYPDDVNNKARIVLLGLPKFVTTDDFCRAICVASKFAKKENLADLVDGFDKGVVKRSSISRNQVQIYLEAFRHFFENLTPHITKSQWGSLVTNRGISQAIYQILDNFIYALKHANEGDEAKEFRKECIETTKVQVETLLKAFITTFKTVTEKMNQAPDPSIFKCNLQGNHRRFETFHLIVESMFETRAVLDERPFLAEIFNTYKVGVLKSILEYSKCTGHEGLRKYLERKYSAYIHPTKQALDT